MTKSHNLYPVHGCWPGTLFLCSRPRGGDWLPDDVLGWREAVIHTVISLLTNEEEQDLNLEDERAEVEKQGMTFVSCPIQDRGTPASTSTLLTVLDTIERDLQAGKNVLLHCRQGVGRTGLVAAALIVRDGAEPEAAIKIVTDARGVRVPETADQEQWIFRFATSSKDV